MAIKINRSYKVGILGKGGNPNGKRVFKENDGSSAGKTEEKTMAEDCDFLIPGRGNDHQRSADSSGNHHGEKSHMRTGGTYTFRGML